MVTKNNEEVNDMWVLSWVAFIVGIYIVFKLSGIAIQWVKEGLNSIRPERYRK